MMKEIIIGTRGSKLALTQAYSVMSQLQAIYPEITFQIRIIKTRGDKLTHANLAQAGGYGFFVKEIEDALFSKDIDLAVHSLKDMPTVLPCGLKIGAICKRLDARDAFISKNGCRLEDLEKGAGIGTSSFRRRIQLQMFRPDLSVIDLRGNIDTRIEKLTEVSEMSGIIVAAAGLYRLKMEEKITQLLPTNPFLPAAGQGAVAVEVRDQDESELLVRILDDEESRLTVSAERAFLEKIGIGCADPVGAYAVIVEEGRRQEAEYRNHEVDIVQGLSVPQNPIPTFSKKRLILRGMISEHWGEAEGAPEDCREIGLLLGERMEQVVHRNINSC
ncbi:MAG: hydroxymethylbilane synthase [bacterium]